jgi:hypothetical protein
LKRILGRQKQIEAVADAIQGFLEGEIDTFGMPLQADWTRTLLPVPYMSDIMFTRAIW